MADQPAFDEASPDPGAVEAHYESIHGDVVDQRDRFRAAHERSTATLQVNSITVAVFIGLVVAKSVLSGISAAVEVPAAAGIAIVIGSALCAVAGLLSPGQRRSGDHGSSERAALGMSRLGYLLWLSSEMRRVYLEGEARLRRKSRWVAAALVLAAVGIALAGGTSVVVILEQ